GYLSPAWTPLSRKMGMPRPGLQRTCGAVAELRNLGTFSGGKGLKAYTAPAGTLSNVPVVQSISRQTSKQMQEAPRKGSDTRERILDVSEAAVLEKGFAATSIEEVIAAVGITKSGF